MLPALALVQSHDVDQPLADLAGEQDAALRKLLRGDEHRDH